MTKETGDQQGFADLREGRSRRITPEVLQQEQNAVSSETWHKRDVSPSGYDSILWNIETPFGWVSCGWGAKAEAIADRIITDHGLAAWAVRAREALHLIGDAEEWGSFEIHDLAAKILADYPGSAAVEGAGQ